jgi:hypothetical protein
MKNIVSFSSWVLESQGYPEPIPVEYAEKLTNAIASLIPKYRRSKVDTVNDQVGLVSVWFTFTGKGFTDSESGGAWGNKKFEFSVRVYASEMAITQRTGHPFTNVKNYTKDNFLETAKKLFKEEAGVELPIEKIRGIAAMGKFGF